MSFQGISSSSNSLKQHHLSPEPSTSNSFSKFNGIRELIQTHLDKTKATLSSSHTIEPLLQNAGLYELLENSLGILNELASNPQSEIQITNSEEFTRLCELEIDLLMLDPLESSEEIQKIVNEISLILHKIKEGELTLKQDTESSSFDPLEEQLRLLMEEDPDMDVLQDLLKQMESEGMEEMPSKIKLAAKNMSGKNLYEQLEKIVGKLRSENLLGKEVVTDQPINIEPLLPKIQTKPRGLSKFGLKRMVHEISEAKYNRVNQCLNKANETLIKYKDIQTDDPLYENIKILNNVVGVLQKERKKSIDDLRPIQVQEANFYRMLATENLDSAVTQASVTKRINQALARYEKFSDSKAYSTLKTALSKMEQESKSPYAQKIGVVVEARIYANFAIHDLEILQEEELFALLDSLDEIPKESVVEIEEILASIKNDFYSLSAQEIEDNDYIRVRIEELEVKLGELKEEFSDELLDEIDDLLKYIGPSLETLVAETNLKGALIEAANFSKDFTLFKNDPYFGCVAGLVVEEMTKINEMHSNMLKEDSTTLRNHQKRMIVERVNWTKESLAMFRMEANKTRRKDPTLKRETSVFMEETFISPKVQKNKFKQFIEMLKRGLKRIPLPLENRQEKNCRVSRSIKRLKLFKS